MNKCLDLYLRSFSADRPTEWSDWLYLAKFWFNTNYHSATKFTPYEAVYGSPYSFVGLHTWYNLSGNFGFPFAIKTTYYFLTKVEFGDYPSQDEAAM